MHGRECFASRLLTGVLYALLGLGGIMIVTLPFLLNFYVGYMADGYMVHPAYRPFLTVFLILEGLLGEWVVVEMLRMMRTIPSGPFVDRNTRSLRRVGMIAMAMAALFVFKCVYRFPTPLTLVCGVVLFVCGLFAFTLSSLFRQAVAYREENELTI